MMCSTSRIDNRRRRLLLACGVLAVFALARLFTLGAYPLMDPTEGRYAAIALEMIACGDWVVLHLPSGEPFWAKPPLHMWLTALCYKVFGVSEFAARLPSFLMAVLVTAFTFALARDIRGSFFGVFSSCILVSTGLFYVYSGVSATDPSLLGTVTLAMAAFSFSLRSSSKGAKRIWGYLFFVALGLVPLAKGLIGLILILVPIGFWATWKRNWGDIFRSLPFVTGPVLTLLIAVPWHVLCELRTPGFLEYYFVGEHWERFTISNWRGDLYGSPHEAPRGTIWLYFLLVCAPWSILFAGTLLWLRKQGRSIRGLLEDPWVSFLLVWFLTPLVFFSFSTNVMYTYVLPTLPPFAILTALLVKKTTKADYPSRVPWFLHPQTIGTLIFPVPTLFILVCLTVLPWQAELRSQRAVAQLMNLLKKEEGADMIYHAKMPYSAYFYMPGVAKEAAEGKPEELLRETEDGEQDFFAIKESHLSCLPPEFLKMTEEVGKIGKFSIRQESDRKAGSPSGTP